MAGYTSIRGWVGWYSGEALLAEAVQEIIGRTTANAALLDISAKKARFYSEGWVFQAQGVNGAGYAFYGATVRTDCADFVRYQLAEVARLVDHGHGFAVWPEGVFHVDDDGRAGERHVFWVLGNGRLTERPQGAA